MGFHLANLFIVVYIGVWVIMALAILREARFQTGLIRLLAIGAIVLGPLGMFAYLGLRYLGQALKQGYWVGRLRDPGIYNQDSVEPRR